MKILKDVDNTFVVKLKKSLLGQNLYRGKGRSKEKTKKDQVKLILKPDKRELFLLSSRISRS